VVHGAAHCFHQKILLVVASCFESHFETGVPEEDVGMHVHLVAEHSANIWQPLVAASSHSASHHANQFANYFPNPSASHFATHFAVHDLQIFDAQPFVKCVMGVVMFHSRGHLVHFVSVKHYFEACFGILVVAEECPCVMTVGHPLVDELSQFEHYALTVAEELHLRRNVQTVVAEHFSSCGPLLVEETHSESHETCWSMCLGHLPLPEAVLGCCCKCAKLLHFGEWSMNLEWRKKLEGLHYANQTQHKEWMIE